MTDEDLARFGYFPGRCDFWCHCCGHKGTGGIGALTCRPCAEQKLVAWRLVENPPQKSQVEAQSCVDMPRLMDAILQAVSDVMEYAEVDYPAGRECGHAITYDEDQLRQMVGFHIAVALFSENTKA